MASSKNIGDQIFNAVQNAVDSQDFSNLQSTIEKSIGIAAEGIARSLSSASDGIRRGREQYALAQAKKRREEQMATIYANPSGQRSVGIALVGWGVVLGVPGLAGTIFTIGAGSILVGSILAAATVAGGALFAAGIKRLNLVNRFERYRDAIGLRDFCYLDEIAASTADTTENVRQNVKAMLSHGLFKQAALGDGENFAVVFAAIAVFCLRRNVVHGKVGRWSVVLVLAGAVGNCIDRILSGYVVDMFNFLFVRFAVFNLADVFIVVAGITLCLHVIFYRGDDGADAAAPPP